MSAADCIVFAALRDLPEDLQNNNWKMMNDVLKGTEHISVSHAGRELGDIFNGMNEDIHVKWKRTSVFLL